MPTINELGQKVKAKYPGAYDGLSDDEVGRRVKAKYPGAYTNFVDTTPQPVSGFQGFSVGTVKGALSTLTGTSSLGERLLRGTLKTVLPKGLEGSFGVQGQMQQTSAQKLVPERLRTPYGTAEKIGFGAEQIAEFLLPSTKVAKLEKGMPLLGRALTEAGLFGGQTALQQGEVNKEVGTATVFGGAFPIAGAGFSFLGRAITPAKQAFSARIVNSLIKPAVKYFEYGKNAGRGVARERIVFNSFEEGLEKVSQRLDEVGQKIGSVVNQYKNKSTLVPKTLKPIEEALQTLRLAPNTNSAAISRLEGLQQDVQNYLNVISNNSGYITTRGVWDFKRFVGGLAKFTGNPSDDKLVNTAVKKLYGQTKEVFNKLTNGAAKELNERYADLLTAKVVMEQRANIVARQNLIKFTPKILGLGGILAGASTFNPLLIAGSVASLGVNKLFSSSIFKTNFAKWLYGSSKETKDELMLLAPIFRPILQRIFGSGKKVSVKEIETALEQEIKLLPAASAIYAPQQTASGIQRSIDASGIVPPITKPYGSLKGYNEAIKKSKQAAGIYKLPKPPSSLLPKANGAVTPKTTLLNDQRGQIQAFSGLPNLSTKLLEKFKGLPEEITPQQFNEVINKATKEGIKKADLDIIKEAAERQTTKASGQSFDEWVRGQGEEVFHGTLEKGFKLEKGKPLFLTNDFDSANTYAGYSYNTKPIGEVAKFYAQKGKTLDLNKTENVKKVFQEIYGSPKLKKTYNEIPETYKYLDDYGEVRTLEPKSGQSDFGDWLMMEYQSTPKIENGLKVRTGSYSFEKDTWEIRKNLQDAFSIYGKPTRQSVYNRWDDLMKYGKQKGYDFIEHTTESPDTSMLFPEKIALNPEKSLKTLSQLKAEWDSVSSGKINLTQLAKDVQTQLVPLTPTPVKSPRWSKVGEEFIGDGKYGEIVYQSPIKTSAGDLHFPPSTESGQYPGAAPQGFPNYFSHIRYEDMADGKTRKILETQSDLMQKENFAREARDVSDAEFFVKRGDEPKSVLDEAIRREEEMKKLRPYSSNDPLAHLRTFREEVKRAAKDGKDTLLIPSGETALRIEGTAEWYDPATFGSLNPRRLGRTETDFLKIGKEITDAQGNSWSITELRGGTKFKATYKRELEIANDAHLYTTAKKLGYIDEKSQFKNLDEMFKDERFLKELNKTQYAENFDLLGNEFVYKLNEEAIPREARRMGLEVTGKVEQDGGQWWKIKIPKDRAKMPVEAFGKTLLSPLFVGAGLLGGAAAAPVVAKKIKDRIYPPKSLLK